MIPDNTVVADGLVENKRLCRVRELAKSGDDERRCEDVARCCHLEGLDGGEVGGVGPFKLGTTSGDDGSVDEGRISGEEVVDLLEGDSDVGLGAELCRVGVE